MRAVRAVSIPIDHLIAEVAAFPFGSERSLELGVHQLDPRLQASGTQRLWRAAEGLLLAAFPAFSVEEVVSPMVARCLEAHGYAGSHLHSGAAFDFSSFWVATMRALADPGTTRESLASPGAVLDGGRLLLPWLLRAVLARYCIAAYLRDRRCGGGDRAMADWVENRLLPLVSRLLGETRALRLWLVLADLLQSR